MRGLVLRIGMTLGALSLLLVLPAACGGAAAPAPSAPAAAPTSAPATVRPTAAKAFVDWVLTKEAGELNVKLSNRLSVLKDVPPAAGAPTLDKVKLVNYDRAWASDNKNRLLKMWQTATGH